MFETRAIAGAIGKSEFAVRNAANALPMESVARASVARAFTLTDGLAITIADSLIAAGLPSVTAFAAVREAAGLFERIVAEEEFQPWTVISSVDGAMHSELFDEPEEALAAVLAAGNARTIAWRDLVKGALVRLLEAQRVVNGGAIHA